MSVFTGEFFGTATLVLMGNGVVAGVVLNQSKAHNAGWLTIAAGWGFAVLFGVFVAKACGSPAAYINPAVAIGMAIKSGNWAPIPSAIAGEMIGAFVGSILMFIHYFPHWEKTDDQGLKLAAFCTAPAIRNRAANLFSEALGTFVLTFAIAAIFSKTAAPNGISDGLGPYLVGLVVWSIALSLGGTTGFAINPARDLGSRIAHAVLPIPGKGSSDWDYAAVPVAGPLIGASLAGILILAFGL